MARTRVTTNLLGRYMRLVRTAGMDKYLDAMPKNAPLRKWEGVNGRIVAVVREAGMLFVALEHPDGFVRENVALSAGEFEMVPERSPEGA